MHHEFIPCFLCVELMLCERWEASPHQPVDREGAHHRAWGDVAAGHEGAAGMQSDGDGAAWEVLRDDSLLELKLWLVPIFCSHQSAHRLLVLGVTADVWESMCHTLVTVLHMWFHHSKINEDSCFGNMLFKSIMMCFINFIHASRMWHASHKISRD
jgi:hypothetical protein